MLGLVTPAFTLGFVTVLLVVVPALTGAAPTFALLFGFVLFCGAAMDRGRAVDRPVLSHRHPERRARAFSLRTMRGPRVRRSAR